MRLIAACLYVEKRRWRLAVFRTMKRYYYYALVGGAPSVMLEMGFQRALYLISAKDLVHERNFAFQALGQPLRAVRLGTV